MKRKDSWTFLPQPVINFIHERNFFFFLPFSLMNVILHFILLCLVILTIHILISFPSNIFYSVRINTLSWIEMPGIQSVCILLRNQKLNFIHFDENLEGIVIQDMNQPLLIKHCPRIWFFFPIFFFLLFICLYSRRDGNGKAKENEKRKIMQSITNKVSRVTVGLVWNGTKRNRNGMRCDMMLLGWRKLFTKKKKITLISIRPFEFFLITSVSWYKTSFTFHGSALNIIWYAHPVHPW